MQGRANRHKGDGTGPDETIKQNTTIGTFLFVFVRPDKAKKGNFDAWDIGSLQQLGFLFKRHHTTVLHHLQCYGELKPEDHEILARARGETSHAEG